MYSNSVVLGLMSHDRIAEIPLAEPSLEFRLGEGKQRVVYTQGNFAVKIVKPFVNVYLGPINVTVPAEVYAWFRTGHTDLNRVEYHNYLRIISQVPEHLKESFSQVYGVVNYNGRSMSICELIMDDDRKLSKTLYEHGPVFNAAFWSRLEELEQLFIENEIPYFDIFPNNIFVKNKFNECQIPVLGDYDMFGIRSYPLQVGLVLKSEVAKKIRRRFSRIRNQFKP